MKDTLIDIAVAHSVNAKIWKNKRFTWSAFKEELKNPKVTSETFKEFKSLNKTDAGAVKDVGGYVGGYLTKGRRTPENVTHRQLLTLDIDFGSMDFWESFAFVYDCEAVLHSTHSHEEKAPRFRLLIPLSREAAPDEYTALARKVAGNIGIEFFDNTTFEINRLMFWPSISKDVSYYFQSQSGPWLDVDEVLSSYRDWRDVSQWPTNKKSTEDLERRAEKQEDPLEKRGTVGAFCRVYDVETVIREYLSDLYIPGTLGRYTYAHGSTANGLVIYDGKFAFSHHGTDPISGQLCNAFDLVRVHKFAHLDNAPNSLKSFKAMEELALKDKAVKKLLAKELKKAFASEFEEEEPEDQAGGEDWLEEMEMDGKGREFLSSSKNIDLILTNDKAIKKAFAFSLFDGKPYLRRSVPWRKIKHEEPLKNVDFAGLRNYIEKAYGIASAQKVADSLELELYKNSFHPVKDYLEKLVWDKQDRLELLFIEFFGANDSRFTRESIRKTLCGAVARIYEPGCKFDLVPVIIGEQGIRKSTFWKRLGKQWFSDTFMKVEGKEALEQIQGAWIIEIAELAGLRKSEAEPIKHFITKQKDEFRPAYGRVREEYPRQCVFVGTTNQKDFLKDPTGNRRFLPVDSNMKRAVRDIDLELVGPEVDQIWAEAVYYYMQGEKLYLSPEAETAAKIAQAEHSEHDERAGIIEDFIGILLPQDWQHKDPLARHEYFLNHHQEFGTEEREFVSVAEIWCECFGKRREDMTRWNTRDINEILRGLGWQPDKRLQYVKPYGKQRIYKKV